MKILQLGTKKYQPSYIYICNYCGCKFQFFNWEAETIGRNSNGQKRNMIKGGCPQCHHPVIIIDIEKYKEV